MDSKFTVGFTLFPEYTKNSVLLRFEDIDEVKITEIELTEADLLKLSYFCSHYLVQKQARRQQNEEK